MANKERKVETLWGQSMIIGLGTPMLIEPAGLGQRFKTRFVGMERGRYIIVRIPRIAGAGTHLYVDKLVTARYVHEGQVYGFSSEIIHIDMAPFRLAFLQFPHTIEALNLRSTKRIDCYLPARVILAEGKDDQLTSYPAMITNISSGGCQVVIEAEEARYLPHVVPDQSVTLEFTMFGSNVQERVKGEIKNISISGVRQFLGVSFDEVSEGIKAQIEEYIESVTDYLKT
jgi:c-di-GMP-binding flagellar brake protein YcgR